ncbi:MAG: signal peptidase II [Pseudomonadota bacterium]|nr:signal peptidase II [Pseudomonadota bacterium]
MLRWLWLAAAVILVDQASKQVALATLSLHEPVPVMPLFNITLVYNKGAAFSFLSEAGGWQRWFFSLLAIVISVLIVFWIKGLQRDRAWTAAGLALVLGGALGNLMDRLAYGYVVDFIDVYYANHHWPTFNIADAAITVGAAILIVNQIFFHKPEPESPDPERGS